MHKAGAKGMSLAQKKSHYFRVRASGRDQIMTSFHVHVRNIDVLKTSNKSSLPIFYYVLIA